VVTTDRERLKTTSRESSAKNISCNKELPHTRAYSK